jgi:aspartate kinase
VELKNMITMKFGGTSVGDIRRLREVASIVRSHLSRNPVVVASAMGGVTNILLDTAQSAVQRDTARVKKNIEALREKHFAIATALVHRPQLKKALVEGHKRNLRNSRISTTG